MASVLYKRYIPPKKAEAPAPTTSAATSAQKSDTRSDDGSKDPGGNEVSTKRKRERQDESKVEHKAKKQRSANTVIKKDVDRTDPDLSAFGSPAPVTSVDAEEDKGVKASDEGLEGSVGEFAHIKSVKKRHKLEKEARKERKAAEQASKRTLSSSTRPRGVDGDSTVTKDAQVRGNGEGHVDDAQDGQEPTQPTNSLSESKLPGVDTKLQSRKRRHKLEHVLNGSTPTGEDEGDVDDVHLRKHKGVMSKFQKATKQSQDSKSVVEPQTEEEEQVPLRDLVPLPEPASVPHQPFKADVSSLLPAWLAHPILIPQQPKFASFEQLGLNTKLSKRLVGLSFVAPLPVQETLIPLLLPPGQPGARYLPGSEPVLPDIAVHAPTGSGKTLAYMLPILESLKAKPVDPAKLRALVVVPTRELVQQVRAVAEALGRGSGVRSASAEGRNKLSEERDRFIKKSFQFDPPKYAEQIRKAHLTNYGPGDDPNDLESFIFSRILQDGKADEFVNATVEAPVHHVPVFESAIHVLIATPGRLLEHINGTAGFSLEHVEFLVLDEADKLLEQQYDGFLEKLNSTLPQGNLHERGCRKVVLSATMSRDVSKLSALKLRRPQLLVVEGIELQSNGLNEGDGDLVADAEGRFTMAPELEEWCVPVGDGSEKPLYLFKVLDDKILDNTTVSSLAGEREDSETSSIASASSSNSDQSDQSTSLDNSSASESEIEGDSDSDSSHSTSSPPSETYDALTSISRLSVPSTTAAVGPTVLIFTSSTESAARLAHLVRTMRRDLSQSIATLTKIGKANFPARRASQPLIVIATDRASRGLDMLAGRPVTHVVQYDVPGSVQTYVHRAGRTARAGRAGAAWTLYEDKQAHWFMYEIVKSDMVVRAAKVQKVRVVLDDDERLKNAFAEALAGMRDMVFGRRQKG